jgi:hypothetical protein
MKIFSNWKKFYRNLKLNWRELKLLYRKTIYKNNLCRTDLRYVRNRQECGDKVTIWSNRENMFRIEVRFRFFTSDG